MSAGIKAERVTQACEVCAEPVAIELLHSPQGLPDFLHLVDAETGWVGWMDAGEEGMQAGGNNVSLLVVCSKTCLTHWFEGRDLHLDSERAH